MNILTQYLTNRTREKYEDMYNTMRVWKHHCSFRKKILMKKYYPLCNKRIILSIILSFWKCKRRFLLWRSRIYILVNVSYKHTSELPECMASQCGQTTVYSYIWNSFSNIWNSFSNIWNSFSNIWNSFSYIWNSFSYIWNSFSNILNSFSNI